MGDYDRAIECFESVIASDPGDTLAYNHLGVIYTLRKEYQKAMTTYKRGLQVDPNHPVLQLNLAETYEALHANGEAAAAYEAALRAKPGWMEAVRKYTSLLLRRRKTETAVSVVEKAIALHPSDAELFALLGRVALKRFDYDPAVRALKKASTLDPKNTNVACALAAAYEKNGALERGAALMRQAEKDFPSDAAVGAQYVHTLLSARDYDAAFAKLKALYAKNPNDAQILDLYGQYCISRGEDEKADACYKKINSIDARYFAYEKSAALRSMQTGRFDTARNYIARYLSKHPHDEEALVLSAQLDTAEKKFSSALDTYRAVLAVNGGNVLAKGEVKRIAGLLVEAEAAKNDASDESDETAGAEIVMDSPETKALEAAVYEPAPVQEEPFDFDLMGESLLKADDEIDPFTIADREDEEVDFDASELDMLVPFDRPIDREENAAAVKDDDVLDGRAGPAAGIDESLPGNIDEGFDTETIDTEAPIVVPRSKSNRVNYEDEPISIAEDIPPAHRSYDEAYRTSKAVREAGEDTMHLIGTAKESVERIRTDAERAEANVKDTANTAMKAIRKAAEKILSEVEDKSEEIIERAVQKKSLLRKNVSVQNKTLIQEEATGIGIVADRADDERGLIQMPQKDAIFAPAGAERDNAQASDNPNDAQTSAELTAALEKAARALPDIAAALQNKKSADQFAIELKLFKKLRSMCDFLPSLQKEKFMASRTRLLLDYVIARLSGKPGLLATAEVLRKIKLPAGLLEKGASPFSALTDEQLVPLVIHDMRTKLTDLPDASLAAALDAAASEALENARGR